MHTPYDNLLNNNVCKSQYIGNVHASSSSSLLTEKHMFKVSVIHYDLENISYLYAENSQFQNN